jgi:hypothetical protein
MYLPYAGVPLIRALGRGAWGVLFSGVLRERRGSPMAGQSSLLALEDVPLEEARRMGRGPRMDPQRYQELRTRIPSLSDQAVRMTIPDGTSRTVMEKRMLVVAAELGIPVTIRRVSGGLLF